MTLTDISQRTSEGVSQALAGDGSSRRTFLIRVATVGSAMAVAPLRFLIEPSSALAVNCPAPGGCTSGLCYTSGYSAFCCTLTGSNNCPTNTQPGGWWYACVPTSYCSSGTRYYLDCVGNCPTDCSGCKCANNSCGNRRVCCNHGYTNCGGPSTARLRCRIVRCVNPSTLWSYCSSVGSKDKFTCSHGAACLSAPGTSCESLSCSP